MAESPVNGEERYRIVAEGIDTPTYAEPVLIADTDSFAFSPDGEHVAASGRVAGLWRPMVDNRTGPGGLGCGGLRFEGDVVSFLVLGEDGVHRVSTRVT